VIHQVSALRRQSNVLYFISVVLMMHKQDNCSPGENWNKDMDQKKSDKMTKV